MINTKISNLWNLLEWHRGRVAGDPCFPNHGLQIYGYKIDEIVLFSNDLKILHFSSKEILKPEKLKWWATFSYYIDKAQYMNSGNFLQELLWKNPTVEFFSVLLLISTDSYCKSNICNKNNLQVILLLMNYDLSLRHSRLKWEQASTGSAFIWCVIQTQGSMQWACSVPVPYAHDRDSLWWLVVMSFMHVEDALWALKKEKSKWAYTWVHSDA